MPKIRHYTRGPCRIEQPTTNQLWPNTVKEHAQDSDLQPEVCDKTVTKTCRMIKRDGDLTHTWRLHELAANFSNMDEYESQLSSFLSVRCAFIPSSHQRSLAGLILSTGQSEQRGHCFQSPHKTGVFHKNSLLPIHCIYKHIALFRQYFGPTTISESISHCDKFTNHLLC